MEELVSKIMIKAIEISNNTKHDVFVWYSGHTRQIDVDIHKYGWKISLIENKAEHSYMRIYLDDENCIEDLQNILKELEELEEN